MHTFRNITLYNLKQIITSGHIIYGLLVTLESYSIGIGGGYHVLSVPD